MQVAINLTPVLVTFIICVFLYAMCKMARQDEKKKQKRQEIEVIPPLLPTTHLRSNAEVRVTYRAEIKEVQHIHYQVADVPEFMNRRNMHVVGSDQEGAGRQ